MSIVVTGASGNLGGRVARLLAGAGRRQTLLVRTPSRAPRLDGAVVAQGEFADGGAVAAACGGAEVVLMVSAAEARDRVEHHRAFVDAVVGAGVGHLVYVSFFGAAPTATFTLARDHAATEAHIAASGVPYTFLRDNLYADFVPGLAADGVIRGPAGDGRAAVVAQDDIAEAAVAVLGDPGAHAGRTYDLTGPESLSLHEIAAVLTDVTGRPTTYQPETVAEAYASRAHYGAPDWQLDAWVSTYTAIANGELDGVSDAVPSLTGHPATPLAEVLRR